MPRRAARRVPGRAGQGALPGASRGRALHPGHRAPQAPLRIPGDPRLRAGLPGALRERPTLIQPTADYRPVIKPMFKSGSMSEQPSTAARGTVSITPSSPACCGSTNTIASTPQVKAPLVHSALLLCDPSRQRTRHSPNRPERSSLPESFSALMSRAKVALAIPQACAASLLETVLFSARYVRIASRRRAALPEYLHRRVDDGFPGHFFHCRHQTTS